MIYLLPPERRDTTAIWSATVREVEVCFGPAGLGNAEEAYHSGANIPRPRPTQAGNVELLGLSRTRKLRCEASRDANCSQEKVLNFEGHGIQRELRTVVRL